MAFGFGFDKNKIQQTAEKYVQQGKLAPAIEEYKKILNKDPGDVTTLTAVGDLYLRSGRNPEAVQCFQTLAEKYTQQGFLPRSIAVYKRITKIDPEAVPALLKLGELYSMQGLLRDARTHYLQAVEYYLRRQEKEKAREVFEKVLMLDMENPRLQVQMAELYAATGKKEEAVLTYLGAIDRFLNAGELNEAASALELLYNLDPQNEDAKEFRGRLHLERGEHDKAAETLFSMASWESRKGAVNALFHAQMKLGDLPKAQGVATLLFEQHEDFAGLAQVAENLTSSGNLEGALSIYRQAADRLMAQRAVSDLTQGVQKILARDRENLGALELLWNVQRKSGNRGEIEETAEMLGHAYAAQNEMEKAREVYQELVNLAPDNREHLLLLRKVEARLAGREAPVDLSMEAATDMVTEPAAAQVQQAEGAEALPAREREAVNNCLTETDIYITYHQTGKAIETLEEGLRKVPGNVTLLEHLLPLYEQSRQYAEAAQCAEMLTEAYVRAGDGERASRYGELTVSYQQKMLEGEPQPLEEAAAEEAAIAAPAPEAAAEEPAQVREVDLSMEWAALTSSEQPAATTTPAESIIEEIEFYLQAGLGSEAVAAVERLREQNPAHPSLVEFEQRLAVLQGEPTAAPVPAETEPAAVAVESAVPAEETPIVSEAGPQVFDELAVAEPAMEAPPAMQWPAEPMAAEPVITEPEPPEIVVPKPVPAEPEHVLSDLLPTLEAPPPAVGGFELMLEETPAAPAVAAKAAPPAAAAPSPPPSPLDQFAALTEEIAAALPQPAAPPSPEPAVAAPGETPSEQAAGEGLLDDLFAEFKQDMEEPATAAGEDLETHYNMGVAFKEMALYDEAIGEFQQVHQIAVKKKDFSHLIQCCSLLATCFLEKGMPQLAVQWYQTALAAPGLDPESTMALLYEMASAYELAGERQAALKSFMEVYARNIDYRNVAERIRDLQQSG
ncbi:MAG: tetratricopeptide repeat protein [Acidobacteria bacterium]|nr:tetratricopeptide repeat protein [Acidobacteriota bacterium]